MKLFRRKSGQFLEKMDNTEGKTFIPPILYWDSVQKSAEKSDGDPILILNLRGTRFHVNLSVLERYPNTEMAKMAQFYKLKLHDTSCSDYVEMNGLLVPVARWEMYIDRDPLSFAAILHYLETGRLHYPTTVCAELFRSELLYWNIPESAIQECCINQYTTILTTAQTLKYFSRYMMEAARRAGHINLSGSRFAVWRRKTYKVMTNPTYNTAARNYCLFMIVLLILNVGVIMWQSEMLQHHSSAMLEERRKSLREQAQHAHELSDHTSTDRVLNDQNQFNITTTPPEELDTFHYGNLTCSDRIFLIFGNFDLNVQVPLIIDSAFTFAFLLETLIRILVSPNLKSVFCNISNYIDSAALLPYMYVYYILSNLRKDICIPLDLRTYRIISTIRIARLYRIVFTLSHHSTFRCFIFTLKNSFKEIAMLFSLVAMVTVVSGSLASLFEAAMTKNNKETKFENLSEGMWWALVTVTTVGYGEIVPKFFPTKILTAGVALMGITVIALATPIVSSNFDVIYNYMIGRRVLMMEESQSGENHVIGGGSENKALEMNEISEISGVYYTKREGCEPDPNLEIENVKYEQKCEIKINGRVNCKGSSDRPVDTYKMT